MRLPRRKRKPKKRRNLGTGRQPHPDELSHDPDWRPSKIKGQGGGAFG